ncbi:MAG: alpha/beta fold hydrolase [Acidimicrobiales bacterium]
MAVAEPEAVTYPGARAPDRQRDVDAHGVRISVKEWGDATAPPVALLHGGFDFARTYDAFAPLLADSGWRVVAWDQRGHGDSEHAALYSWDADLRDAIAVLDTVTPSPIPAVGHSKGGSLLLQLGSTMPHRFSSLVNLDGLPSQRNWPDVPDHMRTKLMAGELANWLDIRRSTVTATRKPGTLDELAARRARMNPRLPTDWLRYLVTVGARRDADGWRWKIDPTMRLGGFGPWRPTWAMHRLVMVGMPVLAVLGLELEAMGWGTQPSDVEAYLPPGARLETLVDAGHFVHIEQPERVAELVLDFLGPASARPRHQPAPEFGSPARSSRPGPTATPTVTLRHNRVDLALHQLREGGSGGVGGDGRPLLLLHGLGECSPTAVPPHLDAWPGPVWALDFTGHGASTVPAGGGYFAEILMGDADMALAHLGPTTIYGRGLGGYVALLIAGARSDLVRGVVIDDGPGSDGGGAEPGTGYVLTEPFRAGGPPDPYALFELSRDVRPPDYAATFARQAATLSGLDVAVAVVGVLRPPWLEAVAQEPGVDVLSRDRALALFA